MLFSCERKLDLDLDFESHLVVNSTFSPGQPWRAHVAKSGNVLDASNNIEDVSDAIVTVRDIVSDQLIELIYTSNGYYFSNEMLPEEGRSYEIVVEKENFKTISATDHISYNATISDLDTMTIFVNGKTALEVQFNIKDNNQQNNYYIWDLIYETPSDQNGNGGEAMVEYQLESSDSDTEDPFQNTRNNGTTKIFITDLHFNGSNHNTSFISTVLNSQSDGNGDNGEGSSGEGESETESSPIIKLRIQSVSKNLYDYYKSVEVYQARQSVNSNSARPSDIYSNVKNGFGIFGGVNEQVLEL